MDYKLKINDETIPVEVKTSENEVLTFVINEKEYNVTYSLIDDHHIHLNLNGNGISAYVANEDNGKTITINGNSTFIEDAETLELMKKSSKSENDLPNAITPPMPAIVIAVLVNEGDTVTKGQGIIVVSAMKMETTLYAPYDGKIKKINTAEEDKVNPGDILVDIEKKETIEEMVD